MVLRSGGERVPEMTSCGHSLKQLKQREKRFSCIHQNVLACLESANGKGKEGEKKNRKRGIAPLQPSSAC